MNKLIRLFSFRLWILPICFFSLLLSSCIDAVEPEFELREGLIFVEGFASTTPGASFVAVNRSGIEFGVYVVNFVEDAAVSFENVNSGELVLLTDIDGTYEPPDDFAVSPGERWKLNIEMPDGKRYESAPELVLDPVPIADLEVRYDTELEFREIFGGTFVPGHEAFVSFDDPADEKNYYYWTYRTYENIDLCEKCFGAVFRDGECMTLQQPVAGNAYFDYICESECWRIRFPRQIAIFDDQFSNGLPTNSLSVANMLLYTREDMVLELQQWSLTPAAYEYYKVLKDIVDNNSGLNAPPPAALVGNMFNPSDSEEFVFGRFTAAATSVAHVFIDRTFIPEEPLETRDVLNTETFGDPLPPPITTSAPCGENKFRTAIPPNGWIDQ